MPNLIGGMPQRRGGESSVPWGKFNWVEIVELAQAHPGVPVCPESLQDIQHYGYITEVIKASNTAAHGGAASNKTKSNETIREAIAILGGHLKAFSRTTKKKDTTPERGNVWVQWNPDKAGN